ncbi:hypothetical protein [Buchananella hordeovulneris]|nr:hypothetical protein [Buchananella hordeovulneris]
MRLRTLLLAAVGILLAKVGLAAWRQRREDAALWQDVTWEE